MKSPLVQAVLALGGVGLTTAAYFFWLRFDDPTVVALTYLLIVLFVAAWSRLWIALVASLAAALALNFFFLPPVGTLNIDEPQDWVAFFAFIAVSVVASNLASLARGRERELLQQRQLAELSQRSVEIKSALLASLAHDLRTPLTALAAAVENVREPSLSEAQHARQIEIAAAGVEQLSHLFQNIFEMAQLDTGAIVPAPRWVHPSEIVEGARHQVEQALRRHVVTAVDRTHGRAARVDPRLLATALAHVLENAAQYSPIGSTITITSELSPNGLTLSVDDEGDGIADADLPHIFERFYRGTHPNPKRSGTGMGLAIVRGLVAALGGRVSAQTLSSGGTQISLTVPTELRASHDDEPADS